ncbi:MAG: hypothetical protein IPG01_19450 [Chitinophagaceae bacterium]|nr:hypothetical protein [Chitinophagaceae bacterium]
MNLILAHLLYDNPSKDYSLRDYYPFGMVMTERSFSYENYRFGFNGQENDDEIKGSGNSINYLARVYDPRLGRFLSIDPLTKSFPMLTPYQFASNTPIWGIDLDGEEVRIYTESAQYYKANVGHTFITVGDADDVVVYSYGRYDDLGKNKGLLNPTNPTGEGVLLRFTGERAQKFISRYLNEYGAQSYELTDINKAGEQKVKDFFDTKFNSTDERPSDPNKYYYNDPDARVIDQYDLFKNNCTTISCEGAQEGGTSTKFETETAVPFNPAGPLGGYTVKEKTNTPSGLQNSLQNQSKQSGSPVKDITDDLQKKTGTEKL